MDAAADWVWSRTHLTGWHQLVVERGWSVKDYTERVTGSVLAEVVEPAAALR